MGHGYCVWFTGLPCAGKSTLAGRLTGWLETRGVEVVNFDGDAIRNTVSADLSFSRDHRHANVVRVALLAADVVRRGAVAVCALVSPYRESREEARAIVGPADFLEVFVDTPLDVCEGRDVKGMYRRARAGTLEHFTGVSDPYEQPANPDLHIVGMGEPEETVRPILDALARRNGRSASAVRR
jgi:adenylyl-sulfate kinase